MAPNSCFAVFHCRARRWLPRLALAVCGCFALLNNGCSRGSKPDSASSAAHQQQLEQEKQAKVAKAAIIRERLKTMRDEMTRRENSWKTSVEARHPTWSPEQKRHNINILLIKWDNGNFSTIAETVDSMSRFGSRVYSYDLATDDYRDIAIQRYAIQDILYGEYKKLVADLETLDAVKRDDSWYYIYHPG